MSASYGILVPSLVQMNGFGGVGKKIDHRRAIQAESLGGNAQFEHLLTVGSLIRRNQEDHFGARSETGLGKLLQARELDEEEFFRKCEIFL